jgi:hypothetical protein
MNHLPVEILHKIFIHLELKQRITCTLVCSTWWGVLDTYSLLHSLSIKDVQFPKFMEMIQQSPHRAEQVEKLRYFTCMGTGVSRRRLGYIFPSARVIEIVLHTIYSASDTFYPTTVGIAHSNSKVESLSDVLECDLVLQMIASNLCSRLETLKLHDVYNSSYVLLKLKNLPVLKTLKLSSVYISPRELEIIHENIPTIQDFSIHNPTLMSTGMIFDIAPNTSIATFGFHISGCQVLRAHIQFYQYMAKKYINVVDIQCVDESVSNHFVNERQNLYLNGILEFLELRGVSHDGKCSLQKVPDMLNTGGAIQNTTRV